VGFKPQVPDRGHHDGSDRLLGVPARTGGILAHPPVGQPRHSRAYFFRYLRSSSVSMSSRAFSRTLSSSVSS
jgi:hypothetical protein